MMFHLDMFGMIYLLLKYILVNGTKVNTWTEAVSDCYGYNSSLESNMTGYKSSLESNMTVLKNYMNNHTEVTSIWVGAFEALLPWIEIRGKKSIFLLVLLIELYLTDLFLLHYHLLTLCK